MNTLAKLYKELGIFLLTVAMCCAAFYFVTDQIEKASFCILIAVFLKISNKKQNLVITVTDGTKEESKNEKHKFKG
jgi:hypothetical protein